MAQMPIQSLSGRAEPYAAVRPPGIAAQAGAAPSRSAHAAGNGGISGGVLRPGAVDQELFKAHLAAAQNESAPPLPMPARAPAFAGIPTLSPAQFAALMGETAPASAEPAAAEPVLDIPARHAAVSQPGGIARNTEAATRPLFPAAPLSRESTAEPAIEPTTDVAPEATAATAAPGTPAAASARVERGIVPGSRRGADGVWELPRLPDKDEREMLRGQKWRIVESERSRQLFLGPDGKFGWDDFLDIINPLQHIPLVNIAYRAITGDEIYGAARLVDAAFGPLAGISTAIDLAIRDITGKDMADNAIAALFGPDEADPADVNVNTASGAKRQHVELFRRGSNQ